MHPVLTPDQMRAFDAAAPVDVEELIERAGWAIANAARQMLGGTYGRRVAVLAGKGNNGADGRVAARVLERWGTRCELFDVEDLPSAVMGFDLVIDAAFGTGLRGDFVAPEVGASPVLAVDIPSGVDGLSGEVLGHPLCATRTLTFVAPKPGLLLWPGLDYVGEVVVASLDLPPPASTCQLVASEDVARTWPRRAADDHKWRSAVWVIGGASGMLGAPALAAEAAARAGAGMVLVSTPTLPPEAMVVSTQVVRRSLSGDWGAAIGEEVRRVGAVVLGPGLGGATSGGEVRDGAASVIGTWRGPLVVDASGLDVVSAHPDLVRSRDLPAVLTPHEAEFVRLGGRLDRDRLTATRLLAADLKAVVLLKGTTTVVAEPDGAAWLVTSGDSRLATAGTGDVLAGVIGAGLAQGLSPGMAAALGAELHGAAAQLGHRVGFTAADLGSLIAEYLSSAVAGPSVDE